MNCNIDITDTHTYWSISLHIVCIDSSKACILKHLFLRHCLVRCAGTIRYCINFHQWNIKQTPFTSKCNVINFRIEHTKELPCSIYKFIALHVATMTHRPSERVWICIAELVLSYLTQISWIVKIQKWSQWIFFAFHQLLPFWWSLPKNGCIEISDLFPFAFAYTVSQMTLNEIGKVFQP